ncbi:MAG: hypothetical protein LC808_31575 [Actinobacteria bacterium]|nr:hypothetical protein [Actinomycetota bacterium]
MNSTLAPALLGLVMRRGIELCGVTTLNRLIEAATCGVGGEAKSPTHD